MAFTLDSSAFTDSTDIPARFTCDGNGGSPPLAWRNAPAGVKSYALILHDPDSTKKPDFTHWTLFDIPASKIHLPEGQGDQHGTPGLNDFGLIGYGGPCPAMGRHRYVFDLYALDIPQLDLPPGADRTEIEAAMEEHLLARARLAGYYERKAAPQL